VSSSIPSPDSATELAGRVMLADMTVNILAHLARLPTAQASFTFWSDLRDLGVYLFTQEQGGFENRCVDCLLAI
jgi:hypothetical protein